MTWFRRAAKRERLGELTCAVLGPAASEAHLVVILCHGYGAPGTDLVPVAWEVFQRQPTLERQVEFIFPAAPLVLDDYGDASGRAWWHLDVAALMMAVAAGEVEVLRRTVPEGLDAARAALLSVVADVQRRRHVPAGHIVLGGFSQGAMLATDLSLRMPEAPAGLAIFSGSLICEDQWRQLAPRRAGLPVLQSHGRFDTILPFVAATWLQELLSASGLLVDFIAFPGDHAIPGEVIDRFSEMLCHLVSLSQDPS